MRKIALLCASFVLATMAIVFVSGCQQQNNGLDKSEQRMADRLTEIARKSGGDWNKVSQADKDYVVNQICHGSVQSAEILVAMKAHKPQPVTPGARPGQQ